MSRNYRAIEKLTEARTPSSNKSDVKPQQEDFKPVTPPRKTYEKRSIQ